MFNYFKYDNLIANITINRHFNNVVKKGNSLNNQKEQLCNIILPKNQPILDGCLPLSFRQCLQDNLDKQLAILEQKVADEIALNSTYHCQYTHQQQRYQKLKAIKPDDLDQVFAYLNGQAIIPKIDLGKNQSIFVDHNDLLLLALYQESLQNLPECNLWHLLRAYYLERSELITQHLATLFENELLICQADLRQVANILSQITGDHQVVSWIANTFLSYFTLPMLQRYIVGRENKVWPFFAENLQFIDQALGLTNDTKGFKVANALAIVSLFPEVPAKYISHLLALALGTNQNLRVQAQLILNKIENIHLEVEKSLIANKQEIRIIAINWLALLGATSSVERLYQALAVEKKALVQATILSALSQLGQDISYYLSHEYLLQDAQKGLLVKKPISIEWLDPNILPNLFWQNGDSVAVEILYWWIVSAVKLKQPMGNALIDLYLGLLDAKSQKNIGQFVLQMFIQQDIKTISDLTNEYQSTVLEAKGILALIKYIDAYQAVQIVRPYLKQYASRRSEICAILEALATIYHPEIIQLLLSISAEYSSNIVRKKAANLLVKIADSQACSVQELSERMVPTANLNSNGEIILNYGDRIFKALLDETLQLIVKNVDGKTIKSLPAANKNDNEEYVKACKKLLTNSKKALKLVIDNQTQRLYSMMCITEQWSYTDWHHYLYQHPIMNRLIQRLVWLEMDQNGQLIHAFRPTEEGAFINIDDQEITLNTNHQLQLAHGIHLPEHAISSWLIHFEDYKIKPLFNQFAHPKPNISHLVENKIADYFGQNIAVMTLKNRLHSRGYQPITEWDRIEGYSKSFPKLAIQACITISNYYRQMSTANETVKLYHLYFKQRIGLIDKIMPIENVPPIILAECYADYQSLITV